MVKLSKHLLKQVLNDQLEDALLNEGEKESVLDYKNNKTDMAHSLIKMIKPKGEKASRKIIPRLANRDPTLYSEMGCCPMDSQQVS